MDLCPYDFELTEDEESYLLSRVRDLLEESSDEDLFSMAIVERLKQFRARSDRAVARSQCRGNAA